MYTLGVLLCLLAAPKAEPAQVTQRLLAVPAGWRTERIDFPLPFAPGLKYTGWEELRFAPGMFNAQSETYFTYAFVLRLDGCIEFDEAGLSHLLTEYYQGLCRHVAEGDKSKVDVGQVAARVKKTVEETDTSKNPGVSYRGTLNMIDVFATQKPVDLNLKLLIPTSLDGGCTCLLVTASPKAYEHTIWQVLDQFRTDFRCRCAKPAGRGATDAGN